MISAVFDTNVLASGFMRANSTPGQLLAAWSEGAFRLVVSEHILNELAHTFRDPYFQRRLSADQMAEDIALLRTKAVLTAIIIPVEGIATHPEDDLVLAAAVSAGVQFLVTGDAKLLRLDYFQGVHIISPRAFLDLLEQLPPERPE